MEKLDLQKEFYLLEEYMSIYIQLLSECTSCGGKRIHKSQLPTFEYFKETYNDKRYSLTRPVFKEPKAVYEGNRIAPVYTHGLGTDNGIAYRYYSYWMGCKYFTGNNVGGDYIINTEELNKVLKKI